MPELPEVEVLARHLAPLLKGRRIRSVQVRRARVIRPTSPAILSRRLTGAHFVGLNRRGKYLLFLLQPAKRGAAFILVGHLGMTGRMYVLSACAPLPKHAAVVLGLGRDKLVYEDTRYFGRLTLEDGPIQQLGPEPLGREFTTEYFARALASSGQPIKVKLLDQTLLAGLGNIYASESLFRARISPFQPANRLKAAQVRELWGALRQVLAEAIAWGSTVPLNWGDSAGRNKLFYYGAEERTGSSYAERLLVYDRAGQGCVVCSQPIRRAVQAGRSTFFCPACQSRRHRRSNSPLSGESGVA
jgi:formamidopyrimidine-DNA glycosylase